MQRPLPWDDLALFAAVVRAGTLGPAAERTGVSTATLSRRMTALERRAGRRLFLRGRMGLVPTAEGRELLARVERMEAAAWEVERWRGDPDRPVKVRIAADAWSALHLALHLRAYWSPEAGWVPEFLSSDAEPDFARREADLGLRPERPTHPRLAGRRIGIIRYAVYARGPEVTGWIGLAEEAAPTPEAAWVRAQGEPVTTADDRRVALAMAEAGVGRIVMPTGMAYFLNALRPVSEPIEALTHEAWLVAHAEARHEPPVRRALDAVAGFLLAGR